MLPNSRNAGPERAAIIKPEVSLSRRWTSAGLKSKPSLFAQMSSIPAKDCSSLIPVPDWLARPQGLFIIAKSAFLKMKGTGCWGVSRYALTPVPYAIIGWPVGRFS